MHHTMWFSTVVVMLTYSWATSVVVLRSAQTPTAALRFSWLRYFSQSYASIHFYLFLVGFLLNKKQFGIFFFLYLGWYFVKFNIESKYSVVGVMERFNTSIAVMESYIPGDNFHFMPGKLISELGSRQHCRDDVTMFAGHKIDGYCITSMSIFEVATSFRHRTLNNSYFFWVNSAISHCRVAK